MNNYKKFLLLWAGELVSSIGGGLTSFGLGIYIFQKTGNASGMAFMTLLAFLPGLLLKVPAGVLADRYDRRLLMMIGDGFSGLGVLYILICMMNGGASVWQIYLGVIISSVFSALLEPAYTATITDLLTKEQYSKANGLVSWHFVILWCLTVKDKTEAAEHENALRLLLFCAFLCVRKVK